MPAKKPVVVVVHGMGEHAAGAFKDEFTDAANVALNRYKGFKTKKIESLVDIEEINYDGFFNEMRQKMAQNASPIAVRLNSINSLSALSWGPELVLKLASVEAQLGKADFLYTHLLDVVFYATLLGGKVRVDAAKKLTDIMKAHTGQEIHIIAHSLGTAVMHDTLALLYRPDFNIADDIPDLSVSVHRLSSVWMVSNVSDLVNSVTGLTNPLASTDKPTPEGCTKFMINVRHELDPFTWIRRFDPKNDGSWIPAEYYDAAYLNVETSVIRKVNTHDFSEYIENPRVALPLLRLLIGLNPKPAEITTINSDYQKSDIPGAFSALRESLEDIDVKDKSTLKSLAQAAGHFRAVFKDFQEQIDAFRAL
jgi:hypothetical protein